MTAETQSVNTTDGQLTSMREMLPDNQIERTKDGIRIVFNSEILFPTNSSVLSNTARSSVLKLASILKDQASDKKIQINGYTDATGTFEYNRWLSERRALSVREYLTSQGVKAEMNIKGYGSENPVAENNTPQGRAQNRRVEVILLD